MTETETKADQDVKVDIPPSNAVVPAEKVGFEGVSKTGSGAISEKLEITMHNLGFAIPIKVKKEKRIEDKLILKGVNGVFKAGRLTAVMGASGAGKTSLLNVLSGEITSNGKVSGEIRVNGIPIKVGQAMKDISGFVFQDDVILVREAVLMSARLRLSNEIPIQEKEKRVDDLLDLLHLRKAANTIIGSAIVKGISGGERKRTALAMEMVTNPSLLFLDEPTSGLDTFTAFNVVEILKQLAGTGRTVIATIHQPSSEIFHMFDDLCLLANGRVMYFGPVEDVVDYFGKHGYPCPNYTNPADYLFMSILNTEKSLGANPAGSEGAEKEQMRISNLLSIYEQSEMYKGTIEYLKQTSKNPHGSLRNLSKNYKSDFWTQFVYLLGRAGKNAMRNKFIVRVKFAQSMFIAVLIGAIYFDLPSNGLAEQVQNRGGALFFVCVNMVMGSSIGVLSIFSAEKTVFIREYKNGYYGLASYFVSKTLVELPFQILFPFLQTLVVYWMVGFTTVHPWSFLVFALTVILLSCCGTSLGIFFASVFSDLTLALAVTPLVLLPLMIFSGLFVNNGSIPVYFDWIKYISPIKYGFEALIKNEYDGWVYKDAAGNVKLTGEQTITQLSLDDGLSVAICEVILFTIYAVLLVMAFGALSYTVRKNK